MKLSVLKILIILLIHSFWPGSIYANETCSRVATINYQQILVDAGSDKKGEGLRFYLEKDPISKDLLNTYQEKNKPTIFSAASSTIGSFLILGGLMQANRVNGDQNSESLLLSGGLLVALSYLTSKTLQFNNEKILKHAVDQYNKRNTPRIYFSPYRDNNGGNGIGLSLQQGF